MSPEDRRSQIRLDCLRLATVGAVGGSLFNQDEVLDRAGDYFAWVMEGGDGRKIKSNVSSRQQALSAVSDKPEGPDARPKAGSVTRP